jgi:hypothetical protein
MNVHVQAAVAAGDILKLVHSKEAQVVHRDGTVCPLSLMGSVGNAGVTVGG